MLKIGNTCAYLKSILEEGISKPMGRRKQEMVYVLFPLCSSGRAGELEWGLWQMQRVQIHFTERHSSQRQFRCGYSPECSHWPMRVRPAANDPRLALRCYSRTSTPWRIRQRLGDIWTCLCLAASPAWPCLWGKHSWESFLHKSCTQEPHFQTLLSGLPTWDTCPPGNHSFCLPASVCKVCTRESSNPPAAL